MAGHDPLADEPFRFRRHADGTVVIHHRGTPVTTLRGAAAARFLARVDGAGSGQAQQVMARATGNFRRGNERTAKRSPR